MLDATVQNESPATPAEIWAILRETARRQEEAAAESSRRQAEYEKSRAEAAEESNRRQAKLDRQLKALARRINKVSQSVKEVNESTGKIQNRYGEVLEYMVEPNLLHKFREFGFAFEKSKIGERINRENQGEDAQVDIRLFGAEQDMLVEVKSKPSIDDVKDHLERMAKVRAYYDKTGNKRKLFGAVAGMIITDPVRQFAQESGFYVIKPSGDTFDISVPEVTFAPCQW
ncbi:MAG: hypothetical protein FWG66_01745 [Spirochaetes bacterium]|nr:hypothetical protein [Spirochaetota bacterium]